MFVAPRSGSTVFLSFTIPYIADCVALPSGTADHELPELDALGNTAWKWPFLQHAYEEAFGLNDANPEVSELSTSSAVSATQDADRRRPGALRKEKRASQPRGIPAPVSHVDKAWHDSDRPVDEAVALEPESEAAVKQPSGTAVSRVPGQVLDHAVPAADNTSSEETTGHVWQPVVYVQDFMPNFPVSPPPKLADLNVTMAALYGYPVCPGKKTFVNKVEDAPPNFCRYSNGQISMSMEGKRHDDFDQYAMERIMLAKWLESPLRCQEHVWCKEHADIVVVPSLALHEMVHRGFVWHISANLTDHGKLGKGAAAYWTALRKMFHSPETGRTPLIVMHSAFAWDWPGHNQMLHALAKEPKDFVQRVVIATTGSNLKPEERALFRKDWTDSGISLLRHRSEQRRLNGVVSDGGPILLTVPYPTALLNEVRFTESSGAYNADRKRPIRVSLFASATKDGKGSNWVRQLLLERVASKPHSEHHSKVSMICDDSTKDEEDGMCGLSRDSNANMWTITSNSAFCVEPPGDTLCRSHFYVSLLSGCIPVVVDGGHDRFNSSTPTWWAWRGNSQDVALPSTFSDELRSALVDYNEHFVVISADEARNGKDHIQQLVEMPEKEPERFRRLRENVDRVAPLMRYSYNKCSSYPLSEHPFSCKDAFAVFQSIVAHESYHARH